MLILNDSLLFPTCIVVKNQIDLLNTVNCIVLLWTITSLKSFSSVWVLQQTHKRQWFHIVIPQSFISLHPMIVLSFVFQYFFANSYFWLILTYILFWASFEKRTRSFESRTIWVDRCGSFRKKWSAFIKNGIHGLMLYFSNLFSNFYQEVVSIDSYQPFKYLIYCPFADLTLYFQGYTNIYLNPIYFLVFKGLLKKLCYGLTLFVLSRNIHVCFHLKLIYTFSDVRK